MARRDPEPGTATWHPLRGEPDVVFARTWAGSAASQAGLDAVQREALMIAVTEVARNAVVHAQGGRVSVRSVDGCVEVEVRDDGPGIEDLGRAMMDGYSSNGGLGCGLPGARRLTDRFAIESGAGGGTRVRLVKVATTP